MKFEEGTIIAINKPRGPSSNHAVVRVKKTSRIKRVGHAGTLDPLASGVLVVGVGRAATKLLWGADLQEKEYVADIQFGVTSSTGDEAGEKIVHEVSQIPTQEALFEAISKFVGVISQTPPAFSALKIAGKPAYKLARKGVEVELKPRTVEIMSIEVLSFAWPTAQIRVVCKSGVYIRSLVQDIGEDLGVGAYMANLVRTRVGKYKIEDAIHLDDI